MDNKLRELIEFIAENSESESSLLYPKPQWTINSISLLDKISEIFNLRKDRIGEIVDNYWEEVTN